MKGNAVVAPTAISVMVEGAASSICMTSLLSACSAEFAISYLYLCFLLLIYIYVIFILPCIVEFFNYFFNVR